MNWGGSCGVKVTDPLFGPLGGNSLTGAYDAPLEFFHNTACDYGSTGTNGPVTLSLQEQDGTEVSQLSIGYVEVVVSA